jgi:hypothetical protein
MHLFVFLPERGDLSNWNYPELKKRFDFEKFKKLAPTSTYHCIWEDGQRHKFAKLCESIENEMKDAMIFEVSDDKEAEALMAIVNAGGNFKINQQTTRGYSYYWSSYESQLRYVFKDIDYDRMSTQAIFEILSKSEDKEKEKLEQKRKLKRLASLKRELDRFENAFNSYGDLVTDEFKKTVKQMAVDFTATHDSIKDEVKAERKEANKNKVSIRQKLSKFAIYNSRSKK